MKRWTLVATLWGGVAWADPVEVTFAPTPDLAETPIAWEALPIEVPVEGVSVIASGGPVTGPWTVALEPGTWQIAGFAGELFLTAQITVAAAGESYQIAAEPPLPPPPYRCDDSAPCAYTDAATGIGFALPPGWASDQPRGGPGGTVMAIFFQVAGEGAASWALNPDDWTEYAGPCREVALGRLCNFDGDGVVDGPAEAAWEVIAPSLRRVGEASAAP
jgi:hypothetical protein